MSIARIVMAGAVLAAGCGSSEAKPGVAVTASSGSVASVPSVNTGGRVSGTITGARSGNVETRDVSFCATSVTAGQTKMEIFALAANNEAWGVRVTSSRGMPAVGDHVIDSTDYKSIGAGLVDKTTGKAIGDWQQYKAKSGTVTITRADTARVIGSYRFTATPTSPAADGPTVSTDGTFDAPMATNCQRTKVMK